MEPAYSSIIFSGTPGSGKSATADAVQQQLKDKHGINWSKGSFGDIWRSKHQEEAPNKDFDRYWREDVTSEDNKEADLRMKQRVEQGQVQILECRYAHIYPDTACKIFIAAELDERARRLSDRDGYEELSHEQVKQKLRQREQDEVEEGKNNHGVDYRNHDRYDLVIDTTDIGVQKVAAQVMEALFNGA
jgi:cytidylate kinase